MPQLEQVSAPGAPAEYKLGLVSVVPGSTITAQQEAAAAEEAERAKLARESAVTALAGELRKAFQAAQDARQTVEQRILDCRRRVKGQYQADKLADIRKFGGSEAWLQVTANKCSAAVAWLQDLILPADDAPFAIEPTPVPDLSDEDVQRIVEELAQAYQQQMLAGMVAPGMPGPGAPPVPAPEGPAAPMQAPGMGAPMQPDQPEMLQQIAMAAGDMREQRLREVNEIARTRARAMELVIADELAEGDWSRALSEFLEDVVGAPSAVLKGPVFRTRKTMTYGKGPDGKTVPNVEESVRMEFERVDPLDFYPSPRCRDVNDGYIIERQRLRRADLRAMIGVDGYSEQEIADALTDYGVRGSGSIHAGITADSERDKVEDRDTSSDANGGQGGLDEEIEALEFWGRVQGTMLKAWGLAVEDDLAEYDITALLVGTYVVMAKLNPDPLGHRPYYVDSFESVTGTVWGKGLPELIADIQDVENGVIRAMQNNIGLASGPQIGVDIAKLPPGFDWQNIYPFKVWPFDMSGQVYGGEMPIRWQQPTLNASELLLVLDRFDRVADDLSVPKYTYGNEKVGGAGSTAQGLAMLMGAATKRVRRVVASLDRKVIRPVIRALYDWNMLNHEDEGIKGDVRIVPKGAVALIVKEQQNIRRQEFMDRTMNPVDMQIITLRGRAKLLRAVAAELDVPDLVPSEEEIDAQVMALQRQAAEQEAQMRAQQEQELRGKLDKGRNEPAQEHAPAMAPPAR